MWSIFAIITLSAAFLAAHPDAKDLNGQPLGSYKHKIFQSEQECKDFLAKPDDRFQEGKQVIVEKFEEAGTVNFECQENK